MRRARTRLLDIDANDDDARTRAFRVVALWLCQCVREEKIERTLRVPEDCNLSHRVSLDTVDRSPRLPESRQHADSLRDLLGVVKDALLLVPVGRIDSPDGERKREREKIVRSIPLIGSRGFADLFGDS